MQFIPPTADEKRAVESLRVQLTASNVTYPFTDVTVLRFLRGRKHVMDKALNGLKKHVEWREEFHVDALLAGNTSSFAREMQQDKVLVTGHDKLGRPIMTILVRKHDKNNRNLEELRSYIIYTLESAMRRTKPEDEKLVLLFDLTKFGLGSMDYDAVKMIVNILQYNYPETLSVALIVGAPMLFSACWAIIKPWLDPVTAAKCVFLKTAQLSDYIDPSQIPPEVGDTTGKVSSSPRPLPTPPSGADAAATKPAAGSSSSAAAAATATSATSAAGGDGQGEAKMPTEEGKAAVSTSDSSVSAEGSSGGAGIGAGAGAGAGAAVETVFETAKMASAIAEVDKK